MRRHALLVAAVLGWQALDVAPALAAPPPPPPTIGDARAADPMEAVSLERQVTVLADDGRFEEAVAVAERLVELSTRTLGPEDPRLARVLTLLAWQYRRTADYAHAEPLFRRALAIREKALEPGDSDILHAMTNLAGMYVEKGDREQAEPLYERYLSLRAGAEDDDVIEVRLGLARIYQARGDGARAEALLRSTLALAEKREGPEGQAVGAVLNSLANLYRDQRDDARAQPLFRRALAITSKIEGPESRNVAVDANNLALSYQATGDLAEAEALYARSLAIREKEWGRGHPETATVLHHWARLRWQRGDLVGAAELSERARTILEASLGPGHPRLADVLMDLSALRLAQGRPAEAVPLAARAAEIQDRQALLLLAVGSERQKRASMARLGADTEQIISLHAVSGPADPAAARLALTTVLRRKGRALDAMALGLAALHRRAGPEQALLDRLAAVDAQLAAVVARGPGGAPLDVHRQRIARVDQERQRIEAEIGARSAAFRADQQLVTLSQVAAALPEDAALVEIVSYRPCDPQVPSWREERWGARRYAAYALRGKDQVAFADLGAAAPIDAAVQRLREALGDPDLGHDPTPAARALDELVMRPIARQIGAARRVLLSPDGALNLVPFGALVDEEGRYRVESRSFTYLTSGRDLLRFTAREAAQQGALVMGAPAFGDFGRAPPPEGRRRAVELAEVAFPPLPSTAAEARAIVAELPGARLLLGAEATKGALRAAHGPRVLHVATHGFFLPGPAAGDEAPADNPLLRSGIALAGANLHGAGEASGVLTALEASTLDLVGTRLIVLSACETAVGEAVSGDGVYGLRRALVMAGAETQVMSLWKVDTGVTRELMIDYYGRLRAGVGRSEALREVQLAMLRRKGRAHPNLWAAFIVTGNGAPLDDGPGAPPRAPPGPRGCACTVGSGGDGGAALALLAVGLVAGRRRRRSTSRGGRRRPELHPQKPTNPWK